MILEHKTFELYGKPIIEKAKVQPPFEMPREMAEEACFFYLLEGEGRSYSPQGRIDNRSKESMLMKCGNFIGKAIPTPDSKEYHIIAVHFYPDVLKKIYDMDLPKFLLNSGPATEVQMAKINEDEIFNKYIDSLLFYFENPELVNDSLIELKVKELILLLANTQNRPEIHQILSDLFRPAQVKFKDAIEANLYEDLSLPELASITNLSLSSFKREFKKQFDDSPGAFIRKAKLKRASELLLVSEGNISNVAYDCGFNDLAHFSKTFKQEFGVSPGEFRNQKG